MGRTYEAGCETHVGGALDSKAVVGGEPIGVAERTIAMRDVENWFSRS